MNKSIFAAALAAIAIAPVALAQKERSAPSVSEIVVTKANDSASANLFRMKPNAKLEGVRANGGKLGPMDAFVDPRLLKAFGGPTGTGKTMSAQVMAGDHFKKAIIVMRKGGSDSASPLLKLAQSKEKLRSMTFNIRQMKANGEQVYLAIKLENVQITSYQLGVLDNNSRPTESLSINFTKIEYKYTPYDDKH